MTQACAQPGCGGTIQDGYCDVCGLAPASAPAGWALASGGGSIRYAGAAAGGASSGGASSGGLGTGATGSGPTGSFAYSSGPGSGSGSSSAGTGSRRGSRGSRGGSGRSSRGMLGAGLVEVPPVAYVDPSSAVLADPRVPESRRFCGNCGQAVGQSRDGRPGLTEGFCPNCRTRYSFSPKLVPGELVAGQYEVLGCLAHGGLGWIYLARDRNVSDRWVVLKGLLNTGDADAMEAAVAERRFLAQVEHPNIVRIYNFVQHTSQADGETAGYIVMEYVGGKSLKEIRVEARQRGGVVKLEHALAYALEILPAFGYLHDRGLVYCDFKPDNIIQTEEQLKLIDMGGVRYIDDDGAIYGTVGYQAPEIETEGPSPSSDLYTVGRTLAVLTFEFRGFQGEYQFKLPESEPLLARHESYARLLRRATHADPGRRFQSAGEMAEQLTGVLREVLSVDDGRPRPAFSGLFSPELRAVGTDLIPIRQNGAAVTAAAPPSPAEVIAGLPAPLADGGDPAAGYLALLGGLEPAQQAEKLLAAITGDAGVDPAVAGSPETKLALVRALIAAGDMDAAGSHLTELSAADPGDWRITWYWGLHELAGGRPDRTLAAFSAVYDELPGELAPKVALGFAAEAAGDPAIARRYFQLVWTIDRSHVSAGFGLARACLAAGDRAGAVGAVAAVPETSSHYAAAQISAVRLLVTGGAGQSDTELRQADLRLGRLSLDDNDPRRHQLGVEILRAALDWVAAVPDGARRGGGQPAGERILGCEPNERALRFGLERGYRALANLIPERRVELVDMANSVRPRTWL
ncbi:serine/threonine protein kinase [Trebonia kvetii]|uniref:non-specific serine/threonine protein kinase n=1 Tax=Trebonia kvetii TaxID=2480626 RepID=A0A6P2BVV4_9ACTN|nr:serine/threonine-protein kinase [Trebonia kvetii]TVZ03232.1 serine/threonine protein kinase [Trebonia kvetii]